MKHLSTMYCFLLAVLVSSVTVAQQAIQEPPVVEYISNRTVNLMDDPNDYTGSPYYNKEFLKGSILMNGKVIAFNKYLRYNASKEEFEIKDAINQQGKIVKTVIRNKDLHIKMGDDTFQYISSAKNNLRGYFIALYKGDNYSLFKKIKKKYMPSQKAVNSMGKDIAAMYREKEILYLVDEEGMFTELPSSKGGKIKAFGNQKKEAKSYAKKNKLNLNKKKDLIEVVSHVDSL